MWRIITADWRRFLWMLLGGWAIALLIVLLIYRDFNNSCCYDDPGRRLFFLRMLWIALAYGQSPAVLWAQLGGNHIYYRQKLLATLPLSQPGLNLVHYATGALLLAGGLPAWAAVFYVWNQFEIPVDPWFVVCVLLGVVNFLLLSMRNLFPRVLIPLVFPFIFIPGSETALRLPLELMTKPLVTLVLFVATVWYGWWVARQPTPHWAPGWGGRDASPLWHKRRREHQEA